MILSYFISFQVKAQQVGINTNMPEATLDVRETDPNLPAHSAGIAVPQVNTLPSNGNRAGQLVYLTTQGQYYYFNGLNWTTLERTSIGDVKFSFQSNDHHGWVLLNGRSIHTLSTGQQAAATSLGMTSNLPNMADRTIIGAGNKAVNSQGGDSQVMLQQNQLPDVTLTTDVAGEHTHQIGTPVVQLISIGFNAFSVLGTSNNASTTSMSGAHSHTTSSMNGGVPQQPISIQNPYIALNCFIYLGL
jgi:hypothetical protein